MCDKTIGIRNESSHTSNHRMIKWNRKKKKTRPNEILTANKGRPNDEIQNIIALNLKLFVFSWETFRLKTVELNYFYYLWSVRGDRCLPIIATETAKTQIINGIIEWSWPTTQIKIHRISGCVQSKTKQIPTKLNRNQVKIAEHRIIVLLKPIEIYYVSFGSSLAYTYIHTRMSKQVIVM